MADGQGRHRATSREPVTERTTAAPGGLRLHVVFRSCGGENGKSRPPYYSKLAALSSMVRAAERMENAPDLVFVNDGPIPADRLRVMERAGEVRAVSCGSNRRSYRAALAMAAQRDWPDHDLVWFAEDDYFYAPDSLRQLAQAAATLDADYLSMLGRVPVRPERARLLRRHSSSAPKPGGEVMLGGVRWYRSVSTTSTFGVRVGVLRQDLRLLRACPYTGGAWDHTTCLVVQGLRPFTWSEVGADLWPRSTPAGQWPRAVARGAVRAVWNTRSLRREERRRSLWTCDPQPIAHMTVPLAPSIFDWEGIARQSAAAS